MPSRTIFLDRFFVALTSGNRAAAPKGRTFNDHMNSWTAGNPLIGLILGLITWPLVGPLDRAVPPLDMDDGPEDPYAEVQRRRKKLRRRNFDERQEPLHL